MRKSSNTLREKHDLSDELAVGLNHRERAEELLQIIGQIRTARVAGIHRDKDGHVGVNSHSLAHQLHCDLCSCN